MKTADNDKPKSRNIGRRVIGILLVVLTLGGTSIIFLQRPHPLLGRARVALTFERHYFWNLLALNDGDPVVATLSDTNWIVGELDTPGNMAIHYRMDRLEFESQGRFAPPILRRY